MASLATARQPGNPNTTQDSKILPGLVAGLDEDSRLSVLHVGPACSDTLDFFAGYRSRLFITDAFTELPLKSPGEDSRDLETQWRDILQLPEAARFDLCLFWDLFNFLSVDALAALSRLLAPHLHPATQGHAFSMHNPRHSLPNALYGIRNANTLSARPRQESCR